MENDKPKIDVELEDNINFLNSVMNKATNIILHFDNQTNILIGICAAVSVFAVSHVETGNPAFIVLAIFSILATICGLYAIHPPRFMRKKGQEESLLYNRKIISYKSSKEYADQIFKIIDDRDALVKEYTAEIYNIYKYHYRPKRFIFKFARNLLIIGFLTSAIVLFISII